MLPVDEFMRASSGGRMRRFGDEERPLALTSAWQEKLDHLREYQRERQNVEADLQHEDDD